MFHKSSLFLALIALVIAGCADPEKTPIVTQDTLLFGAFPRLVELRTGEFDLANLASSSYEMEVDFVDNAGGEDIAQYNIYVAFDDNSTSGGRQDFSTESKLFKTYEPSDFRAGPNGNLGVDVTIPFTEVASFAGVPIDSVLSGDRFQVRTEVVKEDGRVFTSDNSTSAITSAFGGIFNFNINATCPLPDSKFSGEYTISYGYVYDEFALFGAPVQALGNPPLDRTVTLTPVSGSTTRRTFAVGVYVAPGYNFSGGTVTLDFACNEVRSTAIDSGAGCGSGSIAATQKGVAKFNLNDDSSFTIEYTDFGATDGGCGVAGRDFSLVFTKK
ncbi:hypothetical protein GGR26_003428 [Lewinella marina]|uniref:Lipoprotein n=1 Tax=Neolewinella marina TaxID=438751 RepID=A0A2G0CCH7_9BACT|nr:hypothetical protein [Neolewinella marina]NJB87644.1 hypothetical protein [Neolewinella marina]PHK97671.1 hypothetical protein CGL56_14670 [Neolewinella marina]